MKILSGITPENTKIGVSGQQRTIYYPAFKIKPENRNN
jgi:hypothetical protein